MSYRPTIGGRLRKRTSGVDRSQAGSFFWGIGPRQGDWSDLWLDVIMRRKATSDRSVVTAVKCVCSTWSSTQTPGERHGKTLHRNRFAPQPVHLLYAAGDGTDLPEAVEARRSAAIHQEATRQRRGSGRNHGQRAVVLRGGGAACGTRG